MANWKRVYHTTSLGSGNKIAREGWVVNSGGVNIYGRGIYFWEKMEDAHSYGKRRFGMNSYEIVEEMIPFRDNNSIVYDHSRAFGGIDAIARGLMRRGIQIVVIPNPMIEVSTHAQAKGKAFLWLVDINQSFTEVK